jgi:penicillin amidase
VKKEKFTIKDVYNILIHVFSFAMAQKTDPLLTDIRNKYGMSLKDFGLDGTEYYINKKCEGKATGVLAISKSVAALLDIHLFLLLWK